MRWRTWGKNLPTIRKTSKKVHNPDISRYPLEQVIKRGCRIRTHLNQMVARKIGAEKYALVRVIYEGQQIPIDDAKEILGL